MTLASEKGGCSARGQQLRAHASSRLRLLRIRRSLFLTQQEVLEVHWLEVALDVHNHVFDSADCASDNGGAILDREREDDE